jgi:pimeloyl-ACP methyl ester carboxylesterase
VETDLIRARGLDRSLYPFESRWERIGGHRMHFVDEGRGEPIVCVHGNPSWSFYWRHIVRGFRDTHRVIAADHIGCGLSDKPGDDAYDYTLDRRVADLGELLDRLVPDEPVNLALHDWGGMIGMAWAVRNPDRVRRISLFNTAAFPLPASATGLPWQLRLTRTPLGSLLVRGFNGFSRGTLAIGTRMRTLTDAEKAWYVAPYATWHDRIATLRFVQDIPLDNRDRAWNTVTETAAALDRFRSTPVTIHWGHRDPVFDRHFFDEWKRRWPHAQIREWAEGGHYILEDATDEILADLRRFWGEGTHGDA